MSLLKPQEFQKLAPRITVVVLTKQAIKPNFKELYFSIYQTHLHFGFSFIISQNYLSCFFLFTEVPSNDTIDFPDSAMWIFDGWRTFFYDLLDSFYWPKIVYLKKSNKLNRPHSYSTGIQGVHLQNVCWWCLWPSR